MSVVIGMSSGTLDILVIFNALENPFKKDLDPDQILWPKWDLDPNKIQVIFDIHMALENPF